MATLPTGSNFKGKKHISFHKYPAVVAGTTIPIIATSPHDQQQLQASSGISQRKRLCEASSNIGYRNNKLRRLTPRHSYSDNNEEEDDDEDDDIFFGISPTKRQPLIPLSPPPITYSSSEEEDDEEDEDEDEDDDDHHHQPVTLHKRSRTLSNSSGLALQLQHKKYSRSHSSSSGGHHRRISFNSNGNSFAANLSPSTNSNHRRRRSVSVPDSDLVARQRCFDYLVSAIDQVWAQYCDCTSFAESEIYDNKKQVQSSSLYCDYPEQEDLPYSPVSLYEEDMSNNNNNNDEMLTPNTAVSEQPTSVRLMNLKERLLNAKYFFVDLLETLDMDKSAQFWHRWDLVKYATIELVEEADDDDTIEDVSAELEEGRYFSMRG